ncbi:MAG: glutathione peroxidase [Bacteroidota bacterium]
MKKITFLLITLMLVLPAMSQERKSFHDFTVKDISGEDFKLSQLKGKKVLVVNTASRCGLTPQYEDLEKLYREYRDKGLVIVGFPSNDFASQEPGTNEDIATFCTVNYGVTFPMMSKISVKGDEIHPLYKWLTEASENGVEDSSVAWNFQKYMIDEQGNLVGHVPPRKKPDTKEIIDWLNKS